MIAKCYNRHLFHSNHFFFKRVSRCFFDLLHLFILLIILGTLSSSASAEDSINEGSVTSTEEQKTTLINLYSWATIIPKELLDLQNQIDKEKKIKQVEEQLPYLFAEIDEIRKKTTEAKSNPELQPLQITNLQTKNQRIVARLKKIIVPINSLISQFSDSRRLWMKKKEQIISLDKQNEVPLVLADEQYEKLISTIEEALRLIEEHLKLVLNIGKEVGDLQITLYSIDSDLENLDEDLKGKSIQQTAPSIISVEFYKRINYKLISQSFNQTKYFLSGRLESLQSNLPYVLFSFFGFSFVCFGIYKTKRVAPPDSRWQAFAKCPLATTIFMGSSLNAIINIFPLNTGVPEQWEALLHVFALFAVMRLTEYLVEDKSKRRLLSKLSFFMGITLILLMLGLPHVLLLLYVFYVSIMAFLYYLSRLPFTKGKESRTVLVQRIWGVLPAIVIVLGITGYDQLAIMIFSTLLSTVIVILIVWMLYLFNLGLFEFVLAVLPGNFLKNNYTEIVKSIKPLLVWFHVLILITIQCVIWEIYPTTNQAFIEIINIGFDIGGIHVSLKFLFTVVVVFYGALLASKAIQAFLLKNVLPQYKAAKGVQLSITRLVHYAVLTIGFFIMLKVLGFQLNQITLLGGALGVGIGFGLQAIVNNFASGLILLFERPIKVGDTIQIGTEWGEVKQLGLRATIIQTFDNAEIVVPNSDLVTGQVTNWTLADRKVRVRIAIGVAYGTDISKVLQILVSCGEANPMVLSNPKPSALFLAFGASSLDFELRVWIPEFLEKLQVLSDLNQDIENEFTINNIVIPFPQSDLHFKSFSDDVKDKIRREVEPSVSVTPG